MSEMLEVYEVQQHNEFKKEMKRFIKKKKFNKLPNQIKELIAELSQGKFDGTKIKEETSPIKYVEYKLRLPNEDTKSGKSNGYRVIYAIMQDDKLVLLITIYYKKEMESIPQDYIDGLVGMYFANKQEPEIEDDEIE